MPLIRTGAIFKRSLNVTSIVRYSSVCKQKSFNPTEARISVDKINFVHNFEFKRTISVLNNQLHSADKGANSEFQFDKECDETLESLCEHFEEILEGDHLHQKFTSDSEVDVTLASGVLTVNLGREQGTYVINKQGPNQQIWLSSPESGPARFDYCRTTKSWIYSHTGVVLHALLNMEIAQKIMEDGVNPGFENCYLGGGSE